MVYVFLGIMEIRCFSDPDTTLGTIIYSDLANISVNHLFALD